MPVVEAFYVEAVDGEAVSSEGTTGQVLIVGAPNGDAACSDTIC